MRDPERALDLLRLVLAPEMFAKLDASSVEVKPGSWVDEDLEEEHSDLLLVAGDAVRRPADADLRAARTQEHRRALGPRSALVCRSVDTSMFGIRSAT